MERQNRLLTVLAVVLLALVLGVIVADRTKDPDDDAFGEGDTPTRKLFDVEQDDVTALTLVSKGGTLSFAKTDGDWAMTEPMTMAVDQSKVNDILSRLSDLKVEERTLDGERTAYGLDADARVEVRMTGKEGKVFTLFVGRDAPVGWRTYISQTAEGPALLANSRVAEAVKKSRDDFRSRDVWKVSSATAKRIRIQTAAGEVVLRKDDHGWWIGDAGPRAETEAVEAWLGEAMALQAERFGEEPAPEGAPTTITVEDTDGTHTIGLHPAESGTVRLAGSPMLLPAAGAENLARLDGWVSTKLLPVRSFAVDKLEIQLGEKKATYTRKDGVWSDETGETTQKVDGLLTAIEDATVDRTTPVTGAMTPAWGRIVLHEGESKKEMVEFGPLQGELRVAKDAAGGPAFLVPAGVLAGVLGGM